MDKISPLEKIAIGAIIGAGLIFTGILVNYGAKILEGLGQDLYKNAL